MPRITTTFDTVSPESAEIGDYEESGWIDEEGSEIELDEYDREDGLTIAYIAAKFIRQNGGVEPSSSQFHIGVWYTDADDNVDYSNGWRTRQSYHLVDFLPEDELAIYELLTER